MIISWLTGGLGNQMFQYAAGVALAERRRTVLRLDASWYREDPAHEAHNRYALPCWNIAAQLATQEEVERVKGVALTRTERWSLALASALRLRRYEALLRRPGNYFHAPAITGDPAALEQLPDNTYIAGMWQSEACFASVAPLLRLHFTSRYPLTAAARACAEQIDAARPAVAVHFRRGDYARNAGFARDLGIVGPAYYEAALARVRAHLGDATLFAFSDDIDAVEREFRPAGWTCHYYRSPSPLHAHEKIQLMAMCDHAIISNSTFAWWGAWLNEREGGTSNRLVFAPDPWFANSALGGESLVPIRWQQIARSP